MFQIVWSASAISQQLDILEFWIEHNQSQTYSLKLKREIKKTEKQLIKNPYLGNVTDFENIRKLLILKNFSIYYTISVNTIIILAIRDNRRNPENLQL